VIALDGTLEDVNATALAMIGEDRENVISRPFWETPWWTHSNEVQHRLRDALAAAAAGEVIQFEVVHYDVEGDERTVDATIAPVRDEDGNVRRLLALGHDVTERQRAADALSQSEERFSKAFGLSPDAITVTSLETGDIVDVNGSFTELSGWTRQEAVGRSVLDLGIWPDPEERDEWADRLHRERRVRNAEMQLTDRSGSRHTTLASAEVIDLDGRPHLLTYVRDISAQREAERALGRSREELRRLATQLRDVREEERSTIAREIHDELGQRLTGMKMDLSWLLGHLPKRWQRVRERGRALTELLDVTIESVRDISTRLRPSVLDDLGLAAAIEWQATDFTHRTAVRVDVSAVEELSLDRERSTALFRILQESLTNVARHAAASQVSVALRSTGMEVVLEIVDDGRGLREREAGSQRGLGLLGMRERAAAFGGEVEFERPDHGGTRVRARLPVVPGARA
jgi:PAS domain S-box-containing protein